MVLEGPPISPGSAYASQRGARCRDVAHPPLTWRIHADLQPHDVLPPLRLGPHRPRRHRWARARGAGPLGQLPHDSAQARPAPQRDPRHRRADRPHQGGGRHLQGQDLARVPGRRSSRDGRCRPGLDPRPPAGGTGTGRDGTKDGQAHGVNLPHRPRPPPQGCPTGSSTTS